MLCCGVLCVVCCVLLMFGFVEGKDKKKTGGGNQNLKKNLYCLQKEDCLKRGNHQIS